MRITIFRFSFYNSLFFFLLCCSAVVVNAQLKYDLHKTTLAKEKHSDTLEEEYDLEDNAIPLKNAQTNQYTITIATGEKEDQQFNIQFQLGRNQFWLASEECQITDFCKNKYVCSENSCDKTQIGHFYDEQGSIMEGYYANDLINLNNDMSTTFPFLAIVSSSVYSSQYQGLDGAIQFGPNKTSSIVNKLFTENKIQKNVFSLKINYDPIMTMMGVIYPDSELIIGGYNNDIVADGEYISYYNVIDPKMWVIEIKSASINSKKVLTEKRNAFLKLGSAYIMIPKQEFEIFKQSLAKFMTHCNLYEDTFIYCKQCEYSRIEEHPPFKMTFVDQNQKQQSIYIQPKDYIWHSEGQCTYLIQQNNQESSNKTIITANDWVLGDIFLKQIYSIYSYENNTIGFIRLEDDQKEDFESSTLPLVLTIVFAVIAIGVGIYAYLVWKQRKQLKEQQEKEQQQALLQEKELIQMEQVNIASQN